MLKIKDNVKKHNATLRKIIYPGYNSYRKLPEHCKTCFIPYNTFKCDYDKCYFYDISFDPYNRWISEIISITKNNNNDTYFSEESIRLLLAKDRKTKITYDSMCLNIYNNVDSASGIDTDEEFKIKNGSTIIILKFNVIASCDPSNGLTVSRYNNINVKCNKKLPKAEIADIIYKATLEIDNYELLELFPSSQNLKGIIQYVNNNYNIENN